MAIDFPNSPTTNQEYTVGSTTWVYDGSKWNIKTVVAYSNDSAPVGTLVTFAGSTAPSGWIKADGSSVSTSTYSQLFSVIGYTFGGSGASFTLPNIVGTTGIYIIRYTTTLGTISTDSLYTTPVGTMMQWPMTSSYPTGWLRSDGSAVSRTTYADLFSLLSTTYGAGDGSTTFNLPNMTQPGAGSPVYLIKATLSGGQQPSTISHAASHVRTGSDVIDGDRLQLDYVPTNYSRDSSDVNAGANTDLTAHLKGVDNFLSTQTTVQTTNRNKIINGSFAVDQRNSGAAQTITAGAALAYTADRFYAYCTGANVTGQRVAGSVPFQYNYRFTGLASNTLVGFGTRLEAADTFYLAGNTATLSAYISSSSLTSITWTAYYATSTDSFGTVASPTRTQIATGTFTISSTLARKSVQISIPSAATTGIEIVFITGALLGSQTLNFAGIQLEQGSIATAFEFEPFETTLRKCQRYYYRFGGIAYGPLLTCMTHTTTGARGYIPFPVTMRSVPTAIAVIGSAPATGYGTYSSISFDRTTVNAAMPAISGSGWVAGGGNIVYGNSDGTTYIELNGAEL